MMELHICLSAHIYAEECLQDERYLDPNSSNCGILGETIVLPLRRVNGKVYTIQCQDSSYSVRELWNWIERFIYGDVSSPFYENILVFVQEYNVLKKYLCFDELRYSVQDVDRPLAEYLDYMGYSIADTINVQLLVSANAGNVWRDDGIRYYMNSREEGKHNEPHVHVDIRHEEMGTFSLITGKQLQKEKKVKAKDAKLIKQRILEHQREWLKYWNTHTNGLTVDLNQAFGLIEY